MDDAPGAATAFQQQCSIENGWLIEMLREAYAAALIVAAHVVEHAAQRHAAILDHRDVVRHPLDLVEQMRREDHRATVVGNGTNDGIENVTTNHGIETRG